MPFYNRSVPQTIRFSTLDAICKTLNCQPGE
ncbi:hypothetical protein E4K67_24680 [Desulfosporosinus fructosivorans]|uniref:HTH cro/C1-type domain-containing protein n=1 Tax=Desulfosporosinus fructosivorans TaxID=2018669 RepID=A0A4Z0QYD0_9FIRM|nr:hypothetical protein E4K67_24680 [Desulfosporosinus fructosivorans]